MTSLFKKILVLLFIVPFYSKAQFFYIDLTDSTDFVYYPQRIEEINRMIQVDSGRYEYYFSRANMHYKLKKYMECIADYELINHKFGDDETAYSNMALAYSFLHDSTHAIPCYEKSLKFGPEDPMNWLNAGYVLLNFDQFERALPYLEKAIQLRNNYAKAYYYIGYAYMKLGNTELAKSNYAEAVKLNVFYPEATFNLGYIAYQEKKYREAITYFSNIIEYGFRLNKVVIAEAYSYRAKCYLELGEKTNATADQEKATSLLSN